MAIAERVAALGLWAEAGWGLVWLARKPVTNLADFAGLMLLLLLAVPVVAGVVNLPHLALRWVNWRHGGSRRFEAPLSNAYYRAGARRIAMEADLTKPVRREAILADVRVIYCSPAMFAAAGGALGVVGWAVTGRVWMLAWACLLGATLGWVIWPRAKGFRYSTGFLQTAETARALCLVAMSRGLGEDRPIQDWDASYFEIAAMPSDRSQAESNALELNYLRAMLRGEVGTAREWMERRLDLLPDCGPDFQYWILGAAVHFFAVIAPEESRSRELVGRIRSIRWEMPLPAEAYIESAIAIVEGRKGEAVRIAEDRLRRFGAESSARMQLRRLLLQRCIAAAK